MLFSFYSLINIVSSLIFSFYFVYSLNLKAQRTNLNKIYKLILIITILFSFFDAIWGFFDCGLFVNKKVFFIITTSIFFTVSCISFFWILYAVTYLEKIRFKRFYVVLGFFCVLLQFSLIIANIFTPFLFYISNSNEYCIGNSRLSFFILQFLPYMLFFVLCIYYAIKEAKTHLWQYIVVILFILSPSFCGILQEKFPKAPFLTVGYLIAISVTHVFVISQKNDKLIRKQNYELQNVLNSVTQTFEVIATMNLDTESETLFRATGIMTQGAFPNRENIDYKNKIYAFIDNVVYKEDREFVFNELQSENIRNNVKDGNPHRFRFRVLKDNNFHWFEVQIIPFANPKKSMCVTFIIKDITTEILKEQKLTAELIESKNAMKEQLNILISLADIYMTMHLINLKTNFAYSYTTNLAHIDEYLNNVNGASNQMRNVMKNVVTESYLKKVLDFTDIHTISDRMNNKKVISMDFIGKNVGWVRAQFIAIKYDSQNKLEQVMFTTQIIEEEKCREENIILMTKTDELTQIPNRRSYDEELKKLESEVPENFIVLFADINNLKNTNDTKGHSAGDEIICGSAKILKDTFEKCGKVFRTGGDEFIAFIVTDDFAPLEKEFYKKMENWKGNIIDSLNISIGFALKKENPSMDIHQLCKLADSQMYKSKAEFYRKSGIERRRRND